MNNTVSVAKYCLFAAAAGACAAAIALRPPEQEILKIVPVGQDTGYLDCVRIQPERLPEPDLVAPCSVLAADAHPRAST